MKFLQLTFAILMLTKKISNPFSSGFNIKVNKAISQNLNNSTTNISIIPNEQEEVEIISDNNIHHIRNKTKLYDYNNPIFGTKLYWIIISSIPLIKRKILFILSSKNRFTDREKNLG